MYHLGYIVCIRSVCILQLHTRTTPPDHRARNRQNNQPDSRRPSVVSSVHGGAGWQKINCSFLQYWNYHKKSREKQAVFVWKLFCDRRLIYLHFETDEWTWVATTGPHTVLHSHRLRVGIFFWINNVWFFHWGSSGLRLLFQAPFNFLCQEAKTERNVIC